jgi:phosphatidylinositol N-acetylglucosaminyltransferase subunit A
MVCYPTRSSFKLNLYSKENTVLRASLDPLMVSVIPNALVAENFRPLSRLEAQHLSDSQVSNSSHPTRFDPQETITIVVISRLFYNKGIDLLIAVIPRICAKYPYVRFIIGGSGPKAIDLEQMIERMVLQDRVEMLGAIRHEEVRDVMVRGHIYLHPSLTEAFGTVIVEAASCGLYVVCTQVGGIPEVLPEEFTSFAKPEEDDLVAVTGRAIEDMRAGRIKTDRFHELVRTMYSWTDVAERTERVYDGISGAISEQEFYGAENLDDQITWSAVRGRAGISNFALIDRLKRYYGCGIWAGKLFCICIVIDYLLLVVLEFLFPRSQIDIARDWPRKAAVDIREEVRGNNARNRSRKHGERLWGS